MLVCACLALSGLRATGAPATGFGFDGGTLKYYETIGGVTTYHDITFVGGQVKFSSGGDLWDTVPPTTEADLRNSYPSYFSDSSTGTSSETARDAAVARQRESLWQHGLWIINEDADSFTVYNPNSARDDSCSESCNDNSSSDTHTVPKVRQSVPHDLLLGWQYSLNGRGSYLGSDYDVIGGVHGADAKSKSFTYAVSANFFNDRWLVSVDVPYSRFEGQGAMAGLDSDTIGLNVTPRYRILRQKVDGLNLDALVVAGISHTMYDENVPGTDDPDVVEAGAGVYAGRTTYFGDFRAAYLYLPTWNIDGDQQMSGEKRMDQHLFGLGYTVPLGRNILANLTALYTITPDMPAGYDKNGALAKATLAYLRESWGVSVGVGRSFANSNQEDVLADVEVHFNW